MKKDNFVVDPKDICIDGAWHIFRFDYEDEDDNIKIEVLYCEKCDKKSIGWKEKAK
jgi:hypothetical protein